MSAVRWNADPALDRLRQAAADALGDATEYLLEEANRTVPIEEATLTRSGMATVDRRNLVGVVSYDTPYARRQHEEDDWRHDPGRRAHWLERTFVEQANRVRRFLGERIERGLRR